MPFPWLTAGAVLYLGGNYAWHRWVEPPPKRSPPQKDIGLPRLDEGANIPLVYGKCRVRSPIIAWIGTPHFFAAEDYFDLGDISGIATGDMYACSMFLVLGIPFPGGTQKIHRMWAGEMPLIKDDQSGFLAGIADLDDLTGDGGFEDNTRPCRLRTNGGDFGSFTQGKLEFLNGNASQELVDPTTFGPSTVAGRYMTVYQSAAASDLQGDIPGGRVPGYRGFLSVMLYNANATSLHWALGPTPQVPQFSFEVSSYPAADRALTSFDRIGDEANPAAVLYDIVLSEFGKMCIPASRIDVQSFITAGVTLYQEQHGYSRSIEEDSTAEEIVGQILTQIGGLMFEDNATGKLMLRLLRSDYDVSEIPHITKDNSGNARPSAMGWVDLPNKVRVVFRNRDKDYQEDSATAQNLAAIVAEGMKIREEVIDMPGVCTLQLAETIAARELAALSRPLQAMRIMVHRSFIRLRYGDAVKVTLRLPDIAGLVFRVVGIDHGELGAGRIALNLVQDSFYVWRNQPPRVPHFGAFTDGLTLSIGG